MEAPRPVNNASAAEKKKQKKKRKKPSSAPLVPPPVYRAVKKAKQAAATKKKPPSDAPDNNRMNKKKKGAMPEKPKEAPAVVEDEDDDMMVEAAVDEEEEEKIIVVEASPKELEEGLAAAVEAAESSEVLDSDARARKVFRSLLAPAGVESFYREAFQRRSLLISREHHQQYLEGLVPDVEKVFGRLTYGDVELVEQMEDGRIKSSRPRGKADEATVDATVLKAVKESNGGIIRLREAQAHLASVKALCCALEDEFGATVDATLELRPRGYRGDSSGGVLRAFDSEVFVLQLNGAAQWELHTPTLGLPTLDLDSEGRMSEASIEMAGYEDGSPVEVVLSAGDVLYLPRGVALSCSSSEEEQQQPTTQLFLATHRGSAMVDFIQELLPIALRKAEAASARLRSALPRDAYHFLGIAHHQATEEQEKEQEEKNDEDEEDDEEEDDEEDDLAAVQAVAYDWTLHRSADLQQKRRRKFASTLKREIGAVLQAALSPIAIDEAADEMAKRFVADRLPPPNNKEQKPRKLKEESRLYARGRRTARLCVEEDRAVVYHSLANAARRRGAPVAALEFELDDAPSIETLLAAHAARPVFVSSLPHAKAADRIGVATALFEAGLLLQVTDEEEQEDASAE